jgi:transcription elongation factor GreA
LYLKEGTVMTKLSYLTEEGYRKLKEELEHLKIVERPAISNMIAEARDKGDLSENAEYDAAKEAQGMLELKIKKLEEIMTNSRILDDTNIDRSKVQILSKVKIKNLATKAIQTYVLVSETEANIKEGKISINTPIAKGLLGKKVGEVVDVNVPNGKIQFEIIEISR